jgi:hypothetical protein
MLQYVREETLKVGLISQEFWLLFAHDSTDFHKIKFDQGHCNQVYAMDLAWFEYNIQVRLLSLSLFEEFCLSLLQRLVLQQRLGRSSSFIYWKIEQSRKPVSSVGTLTSILHFIKKI